MPRRWPPQYDEPGTDLGQLQRGLGSVARRAALGEVRDLAEMVLACVAADPRWEQIDRRDDYYARLAIRAGIRPSVIEAMVAADEAEHHEADPGASLALHVISRMASLGDAEALQAASRYIGAGRYWDEVLYELVADASSARRGVVADLGRVLVARWESERDLTDAVVSTLLWGSDPDRPPWSFLADDQPALRRALQARTRDRAQWKARPSARLRDLSTAQLLEHDDWRDAGRVSRELASRTFTDREMAQLSHVAADADAPMHAAAVLTLARLGHAEVLPAALEFSSGRSPARGLLFRAFCSLPLGKTRAFATEWLGGADEYRRRAAAEAFGQHATQADLALVRERLTVETAAGTDGEQYVICSLADALGRNPDAGPFPELLAAYEAMPYSFGRHYVVGAIAAVDPSFPAGIAIDCLWDTEAATRTTAAQYADRTHPTAAARVAELRADEFEEPEVREAAA